MRIQHFFRDEEGSSGVWMAFSFSLMMALCALVVDLGSAYIQGSRLQNAADAAALAAASSLPVSVGDEQRMDLVRSTVADYTRKNGIESAWDPSVQFGDAGEDGYTSLRVTLTDDVGYLFASTFGIQGTTITRNAKASVNPATGTTNVLPLGIEIHSFSQMIDQCGGQNVVVKYGGGGGSEGFFGALDLDGVQGGGARDFSTWLAFGYDGVLRVGDVLPVESGNMAGVTYTAFLIRYCQCTHFPWQGGCNQDHFVDTCPRVVCMIAYSMVDSNTVKVEGFAPFVLMGINGDGEIVASWVRLHNSQFATEIDESAEGFGLYKAKLVE